MTFDISFDRSYLSHYCNHSHKSNLGIDAQSVIEDRCVLKKWPGLRIVIAPYGYKSSFGANKQLKGPNFALDLLKVPHWSKSTSKYLKVPKSIPNYLEVSQST